MVLFSLCKLAAFDLPPLTMKVRRHLTISHRPQTSMSWSRASGNSTDRSGRNADRFTTSDQPIEDGPRSFESLLLDLCQRSNAGWGRDAIWVHGWSACPRRRDRTSL
jgi:hypothetical protein